jgi:hypothetical protein
MGALMRHDIFRILTAASAVALMVSGPAAAKKQPDVGESYGAQPDWKHYKEMAEAAVRERLIDPDSAKFRWPNGYIKWGYTPAFSTRRIYGYTTCGLVNSRNRMGGFVGDTYFVVVIDNDQVLHLEMGQALGNDFVSTWCTKDPFPPAPAETAGLAPSSPTGFDISPVPDGAYVAQVALGSTAEKAGLEPGMVIARVNGIAVKGMDVAAVRQMLNGASALTLDLIGGGTVKLDAGAAR